MKAIAGLVLVLMAQSTANQPPGLEVVSIEVSVRRAPNLEDKTVPKTDFGSVAQRQTDSGDIPRTSSGRRPDVQSGYPPRYDQGEQVKQNHDTDWHAQKGGGPYIYIATLVVKNTGEKTIKAIKWNYLIPDAKDETKIRRFEFRNKQKLAPGESATFTGEVKPSAGDKKVEIIRIDYEDGSSWQSAQPKK